MYYLFMCNTCKYEYCSCKCNTGKFDKENFTVICEKCNHYF